MNIVARQAGSRSDGHAVSIRVLDRSRGFTRRLHGTQEDVPETAALQMRLSVMAGLNAKLAEVTKSWQEMRVQWHEEDREEVALQLHTVTGRDYSPEEVEQLVQSGGTETIYRQALSTISGASVCLLVGPLLSLTRSQQSAIAPEAFLGLLPPLDRSSRDTKSGRARGEGK